MPLESGLGQSEFDTAAFLAAIVESSNDAIISKDLNGVITSWNQGAEHIFQYKPSEAIGQPITILIPPERLQEETFILNRIRRGKRVDHFETVRRRKDGLRLPISLTVSPVRNRSGKIIGASKIARDITEQVRTRERLRQSEERFRVTLSSIGDAVIATDPQGHVTFMNAVAETLTGWTATASAGKFLDDVFRIVDEETRRQVKNPVARVIEKGTVVGLGNHTILISKEGRERPIDDSASPIRDRDGVIAGVVLVFRDATKRREAEQALARAKGEVEAHAHNLETLVSDRTAKLRQTVADLEAFSFTISHDLRSPLRSMQGFAHAVLSEYADKLDAQGRDYLERISNSAVRLDKLILEVLTYSRIGRVELAIMPVDLDKLLEEVLETYPAIRTAYADVSVEHPLHPVLASQPPLVQCVSNLLTNAVKFVRPGEKAKVRVWTEKLGSKVRLLVRDNGIGIPDGLQSRIFEPFQRAHPHDGYEGTGMGLAIADKAVQRMNGSIGVESKEGNGSTFWLELPSVR